MGENNFKAGLFVSAGLILLVGLVLLFRGYEGPSDGYVAYFDNVAGLREGASVTYEGFVMGRVTGVQPETQPSGMRFRIDMQVRRGWAIPETSVAALGADSLLSAKGVVISAGSGPALAPGSAINTGVTGTGFGDLSKAADEITRIARESLGPLLNTMTRVMDAEGRSALGQIAELTQSLTTATPDILDKTSQTVDAINQILRPQNIVRLETALANIEAASSQASRVLESADGAINPESFAALGETITDLRVAAGAVRDASDAVIPKAVRSTSDAFDRLAAISDRLDRAALNIEELTATLRRNPQAIVTGTK